MAFECISGDVHGASDTLIFPKRLIFLYMTNESISQILDATQQVLFLELYSLQNPSDFWLPLIFRILVVVPDNRIHYSTFLFVCCWLVMFCCVWSILIICDSMKIHHNFELVITFAKSFCVWFYTGLKFSTGDVLNGNLTLSLTRRHVVHFYMTHWRCAINYRKIKYKYWKCEYKYRNTSPKN